MPYARYLHNLWPFDPACRWTEFIQDPENDFILCLCIVYKVNMKKKSYLAKPMPPMTINFSLYTTAGARLLALGILVPINPSEVIKVHHKYIV